MSLSILTNIFAGNPLDRASYKRSDPDWIKAKLDDPDSLCVAIWNGKPLVEKAPDTADSLRVAYLPMPLALEVAGSDQRVLFMRHIGDDRIRRKKTGCGCIAIGRVIGE